MRNKIFILLSLLMITIGLFLLAHNFLMIQKLAVFNKMDLLLYALKEPVSEKENINVEVETDDVASDEVEPSGPAKQYIATLAIPAISLRLGLVSPDSIYNNIESNITIIQPSSMPDVEKGNLIIAGHSGTGYLAFFRNLYKLQKGDQASITYQQKTYRYQLVNIYSEEKTGYVSIYRDRNKKTLTLITCTKDNDHMQTIYIFKAIE